MAEEGEGMDDWLIRLVKESNAIEGIHRKPYGPEVKAHQRLLGHDAVLAGDLERFVSDIQPGAILREKPGLDVRVGDHIAPPGGAHIRDSLNGLLARMQGAYNGQDQMSAYHAHVAYETLHPFTDGNGRSGRAMWLWMMLRGDSRDVAQAKGLGFLHTFYYQTLGASR